MSERDERTPAQRGLGDMDPEEFRREAHRVADLAADYFERLGSYRVLPGIEPGDILRRLPEAPPSEPEPLDDAVARALREEAYREVPTLEHAQRLAALGADVTRKIQPETGAPVQRS